MIDNTGSVPVAGRLAGKIAIVCGAGQTPGSTIGNGKAIATLFARAGASVLCVDRDETRANETADAIRSEGGEALACVMDITVEDDAIAIAEAVQAAYGTPHILVNNVGVGGNDGRAEHLTEEGLERIWKVNFKGAWLVTKHVLPLMKAKGAGSIINISSLASIAGHQMLAYEVTKAAMNRMTKSVALGNAKYSVRCNAILPGLMDTPMAISGISKRTGTPENELRSQRAARVPMGHMGNGWDTAYAALFLASDESRFVSGICMPVDGGASAKIG